MIRQFTASVYIVKEESILLLFHKKLKKWLPAGGHVEENETPVEAAKREVMEETGLEIEFILDEHVTVDYSNAKSFPRPFLCLLEEIPAFGESPAHQHMDLVYLAEVAGGRLTSLENQPVKWFSFEEVAKMEAEKEIFTETQEVVAAIRKRLAYV